MPDLTGRVALVTGSSGGLGEKVVEAFLSSGATVVGVSRSAEPQEETRYTPLSADLTQDDDVRSMVDQTIQRTKKIDCLAHLVGGFGGGTAVDETGDDTWDKMMNLNLHSAFLVMRAVLPYMKQAGSGRIVAVGSKTSLDPAASLCAYGASKAGLNVLVQTIAKETAADGITANVVLPSVIDTPANRKAMPTADPAAWVKPEAIADLILWLCSDAAKDVNGALIPIYGRA